MALKKPVLCDQTEDYPSYRARLFIVITSIFFIFIVTISCITYFYTINQVTNDFNNTRFQAEKTFVALIILTENGVEFFDSQYDFLLHDRILSFLQVYQENRINPAAIDLEALKKKISIGAPGEIELYMINKEGIVECTTYKKDYKLDFSQYPDFFSSLDSIRRGNEFRSDPWIIDFYDPQLYWKYGYLPTDDHEYVLELGLRNANYSDMHKQIFSQLKGITGEALNIPILTHVEMYDKANRKYTLWPDETQKSLSSITGLFSKDELKRLLNQTFHSKESFEIDNSAKNQIISIQYIDLSKTGSPSGSERCYVGILVFSTDSIEKTILWYKIGFILETILSLFLCLIIAQYLSKYISKPIEMLTEDMGIIANLSLTHPVRATGLRETERLRSSINHLVVSIKEYINEIENHEKTLNTELILREKAEISLAKANKRLTQLSQITRHDILNQTTALMIYLEEIPETEEKMVINEYAIKAQQILEKITRFLIFTCDYEKIGQNGPIWQNIGTLLDQSQNEFFGQIGITHNCDNVEILADPLIEKIIYNLIDNTIRHGITADTVRVFFEEGKESGCLIYQDNGTGIPKMNKEQIFERGFGTGSGLGMTFIREVLESNSIQIYEKGIEGQGARFEIIIPKDHYRIIEKND